MREILFRGKQIDNGEWVEGYYLHQRESMTDSDTHYIVQNYGFGFSYNAVHPDTVGQFTCLTDKNGRKIFEGDIVAVRYEQSDGKIEQEVKRVNYDSKECCWYPMRWDEHCDFCDNWTEILSLEVIGNIHDNPELLED